MLDQLDLPTVPPGTPLDSVMRALVDKVPLFATTTVRLDGVDYTAFANQPANLRDATALMLRQPERECLIYGEDRFTFQQTIDRAARLGRALVDDLGLEKGTPVGLVMRNYPEWLMAYLGIAGAGGIISAMNAWWGTEELEKAIRLSGCTILVVDADRAKRLAPLQDKLDLKLIVARDAVPDGVTAHRFADLIADKAPMRWPDVDIAPDDDAMMLFTSGSTGTPKAAVSTHRAVVSVLMNWVVMALGLLTVAGAKPDPDDQPVALVAVPFFHVTGLLPVALVSMVLGRKMICMHKWDAGEALRLIEREGVTSFTGVPTMSYELATHPDLNSYDTSTLSQIGGGGAARPKDHVPVIEQAFANAFPGIGYGLTETTALGAILFGDEYVKRPGSTGKPTFPLVEARIVGPDGRDVPTGERGEVWIKSVANMRGYWRDPDATAAAVTDGWFHTGDVGVLDAEGYLYIVDRMKDIIIRGGENIASLEVEAVLHAVPGVADVMVFGLPDARLGERVGAVVVSDDPALTPQAILDEAGRHLAPFKLPETIWIQREPLPLIASGKLDRKGIRAHFQERHAREQAAG
ncbi:class I adenylate-forming enzyme family protein [Yunchengibacter salinarum]|uniref:class I adenylate-forming enzyme family protein n=1 Tax=Yunchengibacter salinarum TaxID=3133399 RepID=UPI0035B5A92E